MSVELHAVLEAAMKLPDADREALAERLWESLGDEESEEDGDIGEHPFAAEWEEEIRRRIEDLRSGKETTIPWEEARKLILDDSDGPGD